MNRITRPLFTLLFVWMAISLSAAPITREQARLRAVEFLKAVPGSRQLVAVQSSAKLSPRHKAAANSQNELYYVFNRGNQQGYVIVSGDDSTQPVLGYTEEGEFDYTNLPDNMRFWLLGYENELAYLTEHPEIALSQPRKAPTHKAISPMVTTKWNQGDPYNQECPIYTDKNRCITGCVATAMAQVLYYQRAKSVTEIQADIPAYTSANGDNFHVDGIPAGSPIDWDNMLNTYGSGASAKQKLAVAQLMHYCGVAVQMMYTSSSSGAYSYRVAEALPKYFGYGASVRYVYKDNQGLSDDAWDALLYKELEEGRPFYLSGANSDGGHAFVGDGYDGNGCFHINWGWGGSSDGYFMLTKLNPSSQGLGGSSGGYSDGPEAVIGIEPENYMERAMPISNANIKKLCIAAFDANGDGVFTYGEAAAVTDIGTTFKGMTTITDFSELYNFTGLTELADSAFYGCTKLATVKLPKHLKRIGAQAFGNCRVLKNLTLFDEISSIGEGAFSNCRVLPNLNLPASISRIEARTFENCLAFTDVTLPSGIKFVGEEAFSGCTKLASVDVKSVAPAKIVLGTSVFKDVELSGATLNVLQGFGSYFQTAPQWKDFGSIYEERNLSGGQFATLATNKKFYIFNVGTGYYLTKGEAYGTQAVVANTDAPMRFELRRSSTMAEGVYYLYSEDTGNTGRYLFRTSTDGRVGNGVKACFVDGTSVSSTAYWKVALAEGYDNVYTLQTPSNISGYNAAQYLGIQPSHDSNAAAPTYGLYSDIVYADYTENCHWMLVPYDEAQAATYQTSLVLKNLLAIAKSKRVDATNEQTVYDNFNSTIPEMENAISRLRHKLSFINFTEPAVRTIFIEYYDSNSDGELSYTEAAEVESVGTEFSKNTTITDLSDLKYLTGATYLSGTSFQNCTALTKVIVPKSVTDIYYRAFMGDKKLESVELLCTNLSSIGDNAFYNCSALTEFRIAAPDPSVINLGSNVFSGVDLSKAILYVPYGSKALYEAADTWSSFGEIREMRAVKTPAFAPLETNTDYYVYNIDMRRSINKGEAYGTQAVVAPEGMVYQLRRSTSMAADTYYLYAEGSGTTNHVLFRTDTDSKVGEGVKTCFVDGPVSSKAYWMVKPVEGKENVYTFQVPQTDATYVDGEYLGTSLYHTSNYVTGTYGLYWDVKYNENTLGCQWAFIKVDDVKQAQAFFDLTEQLKELLAKADAKGIDIISEQSVYEDFESTEEQIQEAIQSLRGKLHYIDFADARAHTLCINRWDTDNDGELSLEEAAAVTSLGDVFRNATTMKNFEELRYFTGLTAIPAEAFRGCSTMLSLYIPENVTTIGENALLNCSALRYIALLPNKMVDATGSAVGKNVTTFVPKALMDTYAADAIWSITTVTEYTGVPTVAADNASRLYGRSNSKFAFSVSGAPINGEPEMTCEADATSPIGDYDIVITAGTITSPGLVTNNGVLTVERAPLTLTAKSFTRNIGEENPVFTFSNSSLKNREKIADILLVQPTIECDATPESPAGDYEIRIFGAETANYEITYVNGILTVVDPNGVHGISADTDAETIYDLSGRRVKKAQHGVYIVRSASSKNGKKVVK